MFHGPVNLPYIFRLAILNYLPIYAYSGLLKFDMKMIVNIAKLDISLFFTQSTRRGHPCTLDTFLVSLCTTCTSLFGDISKRKAEDSPLSTCRITTAAYFVFVWVEERWFEWYGTLFHTHTTVVVPAYFNLFALNTLFWTLESHL